MVVESQENRQDQAAPATAAPTSVDPAEDAPAEVVPTGDAPVGDAPVGGASADNVPTEGAPADSASAGGAPPAGDSADRPSLGASGGNLDRILALTVPVIVKIAEKRMTLQDVLKLRLGSVVQFEKDVYEHVELMVNNRTIGLGQPIKIGENFGFRLVSVGNVTETIKSLGPASSEAPESSPT